MSIRTLAARKTLAATSLVLCGLLAGGTVASVGVASAADSTGTTSSTRVAETPLTGDTLTKVKAAVSAKYPGATFDRVETDSGTGAYEAHITKADGTRVTVLVSKAFAVTGEESHGGGPGRGPGGGGGKQHTAATTAETAKVTAAVKAKDSTVTITTVRKDPDGSFDALGTDASGNRVFYDVSADYATVTAHAAKAPSGTAPSSSTTTS